MFNWKPAPTAALLVAMVVAAQSSLFAKAPRGRAERKSKPSRAAEQPKEKKKMDQPSATQDEKPARLEKATFGSGCFWCGEAVFQQLDGVHAVVSGYSGGLVENPTYQQVCTGQTGHAEVIQVSYDPTVVTYPELLEVFWQTHDPTTLNRQGNDVGPQYRSVIFHHTPEQKEQAEHYKKKLDEEHAFRRPIVTEITAFSEFYPAEDYHQDYYNQHKGQDYCMAIIRPKVSKVKKVFHDKLKK